MDDNELVTWDLLDQEWNVVAQVAIPEDETPDVINYKGRTFYYDGRSGHFIETTVRVI